jgi:hypothetical protein
MSVTHGASEYLGTRSFWTEAVSLTIVAAPTIWVTCVWLGLRAIIPWAMLLVCLGFRSSTQPDQQVVGREAFW